MNKNSQSFVFSFALVLAINSAVSSLEESPRESSSSSIARELSDAAESHLLRMGVAGTSSSEDVSVFIVSNAAAEMLVLFMLIALFMPFDSLELADAAESHFLGMGVPGTSSSEDVSAFMMSNATADMIVSLVLMLGVEC